ncbi:hypothetical protein LY78DRAFT_653826 [Colletotrichum sublineola]|nr:hypothetical protein LY78DRAFT_653826 [Colletotrichum sublineola]
MTKALSSLSLPAIRVMLILLPALLCVSCNAKRRSDQEHDCQSASAHRPKDRLSKGILASLFLSP